jgi:hypothetical protein
VKKVTDKHNKDILSAVLLSIVWQTVVVLIFEKLDGSPLSFWLIVIWTLGCVIYALIHDYIENLRSSVHDRVRAVCAAEMRFLAERKEFYKKMEEFK